MDFKENLPRHQQISDWIRSKIESGHYAPDEKLPSENQFAKKFDVSRVTVRRALQTLENEQLIYRCQGIGSFVSDERSHQPLAQLNDFVEDMRKAGMQASSKVIKFEPVAAPKRVASILGVEPETQLMRLDRLRMGDGKPIAFDTTWLPMFYGQLIEDVDLEQETIYNVLETEYDIPVEKGCYRIEAENASESIAHYLKINTGDALLLIDRLSLTTGEKPIYYQQRYYRSDRIVYELMVKRDPNSRTDGSMMPLKEFVPVFKQPDQ